MSRKTPVAQADIQRCKAMAQLRLVLKLSQSEFACLLGIHYCVLQSREKQRVPWQPGEIGKAKGKIAAHLAAGSRALAALDI